MASNPALGGIGRAMSNVNFRRYWYGMSVLTVAFWGYRTALGWLVWELTKSPAWLGFVAFAEMIPMIILGPMGGAVVDRFGALNMARLSQIAWAAIVGVMAALTLAGLMTKELLLILAFIQGCAAGLSNPSHLSLVAKVVKPEDLSPAVALQSGTVQTGRFIGPALAGPLLVVSSPGIAFVLVTIGFMFFILMLYLLRTIEPETKSSSPRGIWGDFMDGVSYALASFPIRTFIVVSGFMGLFLRSVPELMPGFADAVFGRGESGLAWLLAGFGLGAVLSSVWLAARGKVEGLVRVLSLNLLLGATALFAFGATTDFWIALGLVVLAGFGTNNVSVSAQIMVQNAVDGRLRARVMGLMGTTFRAFPAAGALFLGLGASAYGLALPVMIAAGLGLASWVWFLSLSRGGRLKAGESG